MERFNIKSVARSIRVLFIAFLGIIASSAMAYFNELDQGSSNLTKQPEQLIQPVRGMGESTTQTEQMANRLEEQFTAAETSFKASDQPQILEQLQSIQGAVSKGNDLLALNDFKNLEALSGSSVLTSGQKELLSELMVQTQALALTRNFSSDPTIAGPVWDAINAIQSKDPAKVVSSLNTVSEKGKLTPMQSQLVTAILGDYGDYAKQALDTASQAKGAADSVMGLF